MDIPIVLPPFRNGSHTFPSCRSSKVNLARYGFRQPRRAAVHGGGVTTIPGLLHLLGMSLCKQGAVACPLTSRYTMPNMPADSSARASAGAGAAIIPCMTGDKTRCQALTFCARLYAAVRCADAGWNGNAGGNGNAVSHCCGRRFRQRSTANWCVRACLRDGERGIPTRARSVLSMISLAGTGR